ncbi:hypothetical protein [Selenomonas ruminantium]|uniref:Uncharacterized protein n=1 Tax=Selenomonas ruminantium TaxID=971 RepID=A0A1K1QIN0_SELRU|nr:hypothetical protein [Selenomonas ruminantium]SFW59807.1 hypothetical protein SAMN02910323_2655 [Selenomonas ruminantium]
MEKKYMNKMEDMEMDKVFGGIMPYPRPRCHNSNANSMAANVDETQNARWREIGKIKPD